MPSGVVDHESLAELYQQNERKLLREIYAAANQAQADNQSESEDKARYFLVTQKWWVINIVRSLAFVLILTVLKLMYE